MRSGALFCWFALLLCLQSAWGQAPCTEDDYTATYTECINNQRNLIWYLKPGVECTGGVPLPQNVFGLRCDIACSEGSYLPYGQTTCAPCPKGTFSVGGGVRQTEFTAETFPSYGVYFHYETSCTGLGGAPIPCVDGWHPQSGILFSGYNLTDNQAAILQLSVMLITDGSIHFQYKVDAEPRYDGLTFFINGQLALPLESVTADFVDFEATLPAGYYTLKWVYSKDMSLDQGADAAYIKMVEVGGLTWADNECTPCPVATYNNQDGQPHCLPCPANTYANTTKHIECVPCPPELSAIPGSTHCHTRPTCTVTDYAEAYTPCKAPGQRTKYYAWLQPIYCDYQNFVLPANETVPCETCNPGTYRDPGTFLCVACSKGYYSAGQDDTCRPCTRGSQAIRGIYFKYFDSLPTNAETGCSGICGSNGWRFLGSSIDSGEGHRAAESWFRLHVTLESAGTVTFNFTLLHFGNDDSVLQFDDEGNSAQSYSTGTNRIVEVPLIAGVHTLTWNFHKISTSTSTSNSKAVIYSISITGTTTGGAATCTPCPDGSVSGDLASFCTICGPGTSNNAQHTTCDPCPANTFNNLRGSTCTPCGPGTSSTEGATDCVTIPYCNYQYDEGTVFDLSPLDSTSMYGPITAQGHTFYLNLCRRETTNATCYTDLGESTLSFACQIYAGHGWGYDIGRVLGFTPHEGNPRRGVEVSFTGGSTLYGCPPRSTNITLTCDPNAGHGQPKAKFPVESPNCHYRFEWVSLYACPLCSTDDYYYEYTECTNGKQSKIYFWKEDPKQCRDGVSLPARQDDIPCSESTISCPPGQYLPPGAANCSDCEAGYFSLGGGVAFTNWATLPTGFNTSCSGAICTPWTPDVDTVVAGIGKSNLTYQREFVTTGSIAFVYKLFPLNGAFVNFYVDGVLVRTLDRLVAQASYVNASSNITPGLHRFTWEFNNLEGSGRFALIRVWLLGTSYAAPSCLACPPGSTSSPRSSSCERCPAGTYATGGSAFCSPCQSRQYSFEGAHICEEKPDCTQSMIETLYTPCENNRRIAYPVLLDPPCIPTDNFTLPSNRTVPCANCPPGSYIQPGTGKCLDCPSGEYFDTNLHSCTLVPAGSYVRHRQVFFFDDSLDRFPDNFHTGCSRNCGTRGWRVRKGYIDSGFQAYDMDHEIDVYFSADFELVEEGSVSFVVTLPASTTARFEFFINGALVKRSYAPGDNPVHENLPNGTVRLFWNYHQTSDRSIAQLSQLTIEGTATGNAFVQACEPGTESKKPGSSSCSPCGPGTYSAASQATHCALCDPGYFQPRDSATSCFECGLGTQSQTSGSAHCGTSCIFQAYSGKAKTYTYDLNPLPKKAGPIAGFDGTSYYLHVCGQFSDNTCVDANGKSIATSVCSYAKNSTVAVDNGNGLVFVQNTENEIDRGFLLQFMYGDNADCPTYRTATITFLCDLNQEGSPQVAPAGRCDAVHFVWRTRSACPVCQEADFERVVGECQGGEQSIIYVKKSDCVGVPHNMENTVQSCSVSKAPVIGGVIAAILIALLIIVIIGLWVKNRKTQRAYRSLQDEWANKVEMRTTTDRSGSEQSVSE